jgi:hypothetical protein
MFVGGRGFEGATFFHQELGGRVQRHQEKTLLKMTQALVPLAALVGVESFAVPME